MKPEPACCLISPVFRPVYLVLTVPSCTCMVMKHLKAMQAAHAYQPTPSKPYKNPQEKTCATGWHACTASSRAAGAHAARAQQQPPQGRRRNRGRLVTTQNHLCTPEPGRSRCRKTGDARLHSQLARGREDEHVGGAHAPRAEQQPLQQRQRERGRLAGARHRAAANVAPRQRQRDARRLRRIGSYGMTDVLLAQAEVGIVAIAQDILP